MEGDVLAVNFQGKYAYVYKYIYKERTGAHG